MKKAQILSAIALAFALGVVIPVASASATMVKIDDKGALVVDEEITKKMKSAVDEGKESCGWHLIDTNSDAYMAYYYNQFLTLDKKLEVAANVIKAEKEFLFDASSATQLTGSTFATDYNAKALKGYYAAVVTQLKGTLNGLTTPVALSATVEETFTDSVKNYDQAVVFINNARVEMTKLANRYTNEVNSQASAAYRTAVTQLEGALDAAADELEAVEEIQSDSTIQPAILAITMDKTPTGADVDVNMTYKQAVTKATGLKANNHGTCDITKAKNIEKATVYAESLIETNNSIWASEGEKAIANIKKAMNGGTVTDADVEKPNTDSNIKPGNTGALNSTAEGTASTTVSIVAGLATALTALGAGVVAYRNARRSSEN